MAESMIALVILGFAASGVVIPFSSGSRVRAEGLRRSLAANLANDLIEQVLQEDFSNIISNYNYSEAKGQIKNYQGDRFADSRYRNFSRAISSEEVYVAQERGDLDAKFICVTVTVYYSGIELLEVKRLITD